MDPVTLAYTSLTIITTTQRVVTAMTVCFAAVAADSTVQNQMIDRWGCAVVVSSREQKFVEDYCTHVSLTALFRKNLFEGKP